MRKARFAVLLIGAALSAPVAAQAPSSASTLAEVARQDQVNAIEGPVTGRLNRNERAATTVARPTPQAQAEYQADVAAYRARVEADHAIVAQDTARYAMRQAAYADAMAAWRVQAAACAKGKRAICNAPAPDPTAFY